MKKFIYIFKIIKLFVSTKKIFSTPNNKQIIIFDNYNSRDQVKKIFKKDKFAEILCPSENYDLEYIYVSFLLFIKKKFFFTFSSNNERCNDPIIVYFFILIFKLLK